MRRIGPARISLLAAILFASALNLAAQLPTPIDTRVPPPPPREEPKPDSVAASAAPVPAPTVPVPEKVTIPSGTQFAVVLATPLSTRIAKKGQEVVFQTSDAVRLDDGLELPAETEFVGTVVEMRKPGAFGARGKIRVAVKSIRLANGNKTEVVARLDSAEAEAIGRAAADSNRAADLMDLAQWTLNGTVLGGAIHGGKGAAIGAGAGAAVALIVMMSHRGPDLYLEAGTPFSVCGEMASEPLSAVLLLGLGYDRLSVSPPALPLVKWVVRTVPEPAAARAAESALAAASADDVS